MSAGPHDQYDPPVISACTSHSRTAWCAAPVAFLIFDEFDPFPVGALCLGCKPTFEALFGPLGKHPSPWLRLERIPG